MNKIEAVRKESRFAVPSILTELKNKESQKTE